MSSFEKLVKNPKDLRRVFDGGEWLEGPCWLPEKQVLRFSDVIGNKIYDYDPVTDQTTIHDDNPDHVNGRTVGLNGEVIQCSHGKRRVEKDIDGVVHVVVDRVGEAKFNSPNDVIVSSDGSIWFTDPAYGIIYPEEGHPGKREYGDHWVFRVSPDNKLSVAITDLVEPNGLAFSPDETILYVADSAQLNRDGFFGRHHIRRYHVDDWRIKAGEDFIEIDSGVPDGIKVDEHGNIWSSSFSGVVVFSPEGKEIGSIQVPEKVGNLCFGGENGNILYMTASTSLYAIETTTRDAKYSKITGS